MKKKKSLKSQIKEKIRNKKRDKKMELIHSGATLMDLILGGGYPLGYVVNIAGEQSAGKTLLTLEMISAAAHKYGDDFVWKYDDVESGMTFDTEVLFDLEIPEGTLICSDTVERFKFNLNEFLDTIPKNKKAIYIIDSLDMLGSDAAMSRSKKEMDAMRKGKEVSVGSYNLEKQKYLKQIFCEFGSKLKHHNCMLFIVSQVTYNLGIGKKYNRSGGKALDHQAVQVLWLKKAEKVDHKKLNIAIGETIEVYVEKNKVGKAFRKCYLNILYDYGLDNISTNIDYLYELKTDRGSQRALHKQEFDGQEFKFRKDLIKYVEENNKEALLIQKVKEKWEGIEEQLAPKRKNKYE